MKTIYKYPIEITDKQEIQMHGEVDVLHAGLDTHGLPCVWAMVDSECETGPVTIHLIGTGNPMPSVLPYRYVGSFVQDVFVWHVFLGIPVQP